MEISEIVKHSKNSMFVGIVMGIFLGAWLMALATLDRNDTRTEIIKNAWYHGYLAAQVNSLNYFNTGLSINIDDSWKKDSLEIVNLTE